jgi:hypothetical protein
VSDLVKSDPRHLVRNIDDLARVSKLLADSGYFTDARDAAQCGVKVLAGLEMGIGAFSSMAGIHVIKGKPSIGAGLMAAAVKRSGKYNYRVTKHTASECIIDFFERGEHCGTSSFSLDDAKAAGLVNNDNWKKSPRNMLFARALSNGVRWYAPDVFDASTYVPEELGADVDEEGNLVRMPAATAAATVVVQPIAAKAARAPEVIEDAEVIDDETPMTPEQLQLIMNVFKVANIDVRTKSGKEQASDFLSYVLEQPVTTMKGMTERDAAAFLLPFLSAEGRIDDAEVKAIIAEFMVEDPA